jgi:glucan phosphoethanolaminetransferase (alkaline phosphatase superfamily)
MLFLIFLGGLLVIFIYLAALIPNEVFLFRPMIILLLLATLILVVAMATTKIRVASSNRMILLRNFRFSYMRTFIPIGLLYLLAGLYSAIYICENTKTPLKTNTYE